MSLVAHPHEAASALEPACTRLFVAPSFEVAECGRHACTLDLKHAGPRDVQIRWELCGPADAPLLFDIPLEARWQAAAGRLGVDMMHVASHSGRA